MITTLPDEPDLSTVVRARWLRRLGATVLVLFVVAGAIGAFGTRTTTKTVEGNGYRVTVTYPSHSRPGHAVRFKVAIHADQGFTDPIRIRMAATYFELFDENAFDPDADAQTMDPQYSYLEYGPPPGNDFLISSDTRIEPSRQRGESGSVSVLDDQGTPLVTVGFRTRIWP
jgi:hypothetical protein